MTFLNKSLVAIALVGTSAAMAASHITYELRTPLSWGKAAVTNPGGGDGPGEGSSPGDNESPTPPKEPTAANFVVTPPLLAFGSVGVGGRGEESFVISNTGEKAIALQGALDPLAAPYSLTSDCGLEIEAGTYCTATVLYQPTELGTYNLTLPVVSASLGSKQVRIEGG